MFEDRGVSARLSPRAGWISRLLASTVLSGTALCGLSAPGLAQDAAGAIELSELSVTGQGRGATLGGALYGPGGALGAVPG